MTYTTKEAFDLGRNVVELGGLSLATWLTVKHAWFLITTGTTAQVHTDLGMSLLALVVSIGAAAMVYATVAETTRIIQEKRKDEENGL